MTYFKELERLLKIEQAEDRLQYQKLLENTSTQQRRDAGLAWYPVAIRGSEMTRGEYLKVELERPSHTDLSHQFRSGAPAVFFTNHNRKEEYIEGTINHVSGNRLTIIIKDDQLPAWSRDGKLGVELLFDNASYADMADALKAASQNVEKSELLQILTGQSTPSFDDIHPFNIPTLNPSQQTAVHKILSARHLAVVHGPPGTGKTTTIVAAIKQLYKKESKTILVVAPSNAAVDLLAERLDATGMKALRIGNPARVSEELSRLTLEAKAEQHPQHAQIKALKRQASEYQKMAHKYKREFGKSERDQRKALFDEAHKILKEVEDIEKYIVEDVIAKAEVVLATPVGANHYMVRSQTYHTCIIDEAGQALEPQCWIPILKAQKVILAGDHCQLPPTIKSAEAARDGLSTTLLEKMVASHPSAVVLLNTQYRMNQQIMGYSSQYFYGQRLEAHPSVASRLMFASDLALEFIDTVGCSYDELPEGTALSNPDEAALLYRHIAAYRQFNTIPADASWAIISPYRAQVSILKDLAEADKTLPKQFSINTIDSFQGQERDIVYISLVRSNAKQEIGFLADLRRMNVAMTRARKKLVVIGDSATLAKSTFYSDFISYVDQHGGYKTAWEYMP